jgi:Galactosyltransferase
MVVCKPNVDVDFPRGRLSIRHRSQISKSDVVRLLSLGVLISLVIVYLDNTVGGIFNYSDGVDQSQVDARLVFFKKLTNEMRSGQSFGSLRQCDAYLLILTSLRQNITRDAIRAGWLKDMKECRGHLNFKHKFIVGHEDVVSRQIFDVLSEEMKLHDDILILPFVDSYWNLTVKVNLMFKNPMILNQCRYIAKIDSDVYIRADRLTRVIRRLPNAHPIYAGFYYDQKKRTMRVPRDPAYKFSFTLEEHPDELFPPYIGGPLYLISNSVALRLPYTINSLLNDYGEVEEIPSTYTPDRPPIYRLEDVYMGTLIKSMVPTVIFLHIAKLILDHDHVRAKAQVALHNMTDPMIMARGHELLD